MFSKRSAISQTKGTGAGGGPPAQPASNEAGRSRNAHDNGSDRRHRGHHPRGPAPLEGRSTRSQHGSSSGGSRVVHGIQECVRELPDRGVHGQPVVREHDHGVSAKRGAERPVVAPALVAAGAPLNARLRAGRRTSASTPRRPCPGLTGPSRPWSQSPPLSRPKPQLSMHGPRVSRPRRRWRRSRVVEGNSDIMRGRGRPTGSGAKKPTAPSRRTPKSGRDHAGDLNRLTLRTATSSRSPERRAANGRPGPGRARRRDPDPVRGPVRARQQRLTR